MRPVQRHVRLIVPVLLASVVLTGCFTGKRAHFADGSNAAPTTTIAPVADPAVQAVIAKLGAPSPGDFTASYTIITKYGNLTTPSVVTQSGQAGRSITVGHVRFITQGENSQTCELTTGSCSAGLLDQSISDTQLPHDFYSASVASRLRHDVDTMVSAAVGSTKVVAGQNATCVETHFAAGNKTYCVLDNGLLAQQDTPDVRIDLTGLTATADTTLFTATTTVATTTVATIPPATSTTIA